MLPERMAVVLEPGTIIADRYRLDRLLGQGGMGVVWAATHAITRRTVAMKFVRSSLQQRAELRRRLLREAQAVAAVRHPNVVEILDVFELDADTPVIVMALLQGETLGQRLAREPRLSMTEAAGYLLPVISAIGTAHARGIVHRDLKPDNIYLSDEAEGTRVKVLDFGIAKLLGIDRAPHDSMSTQSGSTLGTPSYMAPEQASGEKDVDHRADIWALGVIAYECLSGMRPIEGENAGQVIMRLMTTGITPLARVTRGLPKDVTSLVDRMLAREVKRRCQDLLEARSVFTRYTETSAPAFGEPRSELPMAVERDSRRSSVPVTASARAPADNDLATLVNAAPPFPRDASGAAHVERTRKTRFKGMSIIIAASSALGLLGWRLVSPAARPDPLVTPPNGVSAISTAATSAAATIVDRASPALQPAPNASASRITAVTPSTRGSSLRSAPPASPTLAPPLPTPKPAIQATGTGTRSTSQVPDLSASSLPAASPSAGDNTARPRSPGLVTEAPF